MVAPLHAMELPYPKHPHNTKIITGSGNLSLTPGSVGQGISPSPSSAFFLDGKNLGLKHQHPVKGKGQAEIEAGHHSGQGDDADGHHGGNGGGKRGTDRLPHEGMDRLLEGGAFLPVPENGGIKQEPGQHRLDLRCCRFLAAVGLEGEGAGAEADPLPQYPGSRAVPG